MPRRTMKQYAQMVNPHDPDDEDDGQTIEGASAPVVQHRSPLARVLLPVLLVAVIAAAGWGYINRGTIAAPNIMAYTETKDAYFVADDSEAGGGVLASVVRQRSTRFIQKTMGCDNIELTPLGVHGGAWHVECKGIER